MAHRGLLARQFRLLGSAGITRAVIHLHRIEQVAQEGETA